MWAETYRWEWVHNVKWGAVEVERTPGKAASGGRKGLCLLKAQETDLHGSKLLNRGRMVWGKIGNVSCKQWDFCSSSSEKLLKGVAKRGGHDLLWIDQSGCWVKIDSNNAREEGGRLLSNSRHEIRVDLRQDGSSRSRDKRTDLRCILEIRWTECADDLYVVESIRKPVRDDAEIFSLSSWMDGVTTYWERKLGESQVRSKVLCWTWQCEITLSQKMEMPSSHLTISVLSLEEQNHRHLVVKTVEPGEIIQG